MERADIKLAIDRLHSVEIFIAAEDNLIIAESISMLEKCGNEIASLKDHLQRGKEQEAYLHEQLAECKKDAERMDFADTFFAIDELMNGMAWNLKGLVSHPDLTGFDKQETDSTVFPIEYVKQLGCCDFGYHGTVYLPSSYSNGDGGKLYIHIEYAE